MQFGVELFILFCCNLQSLMGNFLVCRWNLLRISVIRAANFSSGWPTTLLNSTRRTMLRIQVKNLFAISTKACFYGRAIYAAVSTTPFLCFLLSCRLCCAPAKCIVFTGKQKKIPRQTRADTKRGH